MSKDQAFNGPDCGVDGCQREVGHIGDHRRVEQITPRSIDRAAFGLDDHEWESVGNIECRCGDVYPTVVSFHEHIHLSHPDADHPFAPVDDLEAEIVRLRGAAQAIVDAYYALPWPEAWIDSRHAPGADALGRPIAALRAMLEKP